MLYVININLYGPTLGTVYLTVHYIVCLGSIIFLSFFVQKYYKSTLIARWNTSKKFTITPETLKTRYLELPRGNRSESSRYLGQIIYYHYCETSKENTLWFVLLEGLEKKTRVLEIEISIKILNNNYSSRTSLRIFSAHWLDMWLYFFVVLQLM